MTITTRCVGIHIYPKHGRYVTLQWPDERYQNVDLKREFDLQDNQNQFNIGDDVVISFALKERF